MAGLWSIIIPSTTAITNLITNPSAETVTTGWTAQAGSTLTRSTFNATRGYCRLTLLCDTAVNAGLYYSELALTSAVDYTFAFDHSGTNISYAAYFSDSDGAQVGTATTWTGIGSSTAGVGQYIRKSVLYSATATANYRVYVVNNNVDSDT